MLRRRLAYFGATPAQLSEFESCYRRWGQGTVQITLAPERKNLLRLVRLTLPDLAEPYP
jgi:hypothetical protein